MFKMHEYLSSNFSFCFDPTTIEVFIFLCLTREEYEEGYKDKYAEYEKQMLVWKKHMKLRVISFALLPLFRNISAFIF